MISVKKMIATIVTLGLCVSMSVAEGRPLEEIALVSEGKPSATIVVANNPSASARLAALELQYHIHNIKPRAGAVEASFATPTRSLCKRSRR
ncbi:MAG: hypothetical protein ISS70_13395 [Phycisphaerae bacterium]|nr:hypothetical protein [Phycisphaerae bacterium]